MKACRKSAKFGLAFGIGFRKLDLEMQIPLKHLKIKKFFPSSRL